MTQKAVYVNPLLSFGEVLTFSGLILDILHYSVDYLNNIAAVFMVPQFGLLPARDLMTFVLHGEKLLDKFGEEVTELIVILWLHYLIVFLWNKSSCK